MISYIFELNRMPSINFMAEIEQFMNSRKEELQELSKTQFELTSRVLAKQEEKREMRKKIDELRHFFNLIETREVLENDIAAQESRILQLRGQMKNPRPPADASKKAANDASAADQNSPKIKLQTSEQPAGTKGPNSPATPPRDAPLISLNNCGTMEKWMIILELKYFIKLL